MPFFVLFSKKMLTSSLEESRPKPSRKTTVRQQQQPLFTSNTEPSQLCRHGSPASDSAPHAVIGLTDFVFPAPKSRRSSARPPWLPNKFAAARGV